MRTQNALVLESGIGIVGATKNGGDDASSPLFNRDGGIVSHVVIIIVIVFVVVFVVFARV
jgi:hypothetical protein